MSQTKPVWRPCLATWFVTLLWVEHTVLVLDKLFLHATKKGHSDIFLHFILTELPSIYLEQFTSDINLNIIKTKCIIL